MGAVLVPGHFSSQSSSAPACLRARLRAALTVRCMDLHVVPGARGEGVYRLLDELSERHLQLLETLAAEEIDAEPNDDGTLNEQLRDEITPVSYTHLTLPTIYSV